MNMPSLKRPVHPMSDDVARALLERGLLQQYQARPPYQRNDYIGWIGRAKRGDTRRKRLNQMLEELEAGKNYMGMKYNERGDGKP